MHFRSVNLFAAALAAAFLLSAAPGPARAQADGAGAVEKTEARLTVVELFTSHSCAACPPADELLGDLAQRDDVLALGFHVDYWDYIGWKDPFGDPANTRRQEIYAERLGLPYVFTPQFVVDGTMYGSGHERREIRDYIERAAARDKPWFDVELSYVDAREVSVRLPESDYTGEAEVLLVRYDEKHTTHVLRGENGGRQLTNFHVVRQVRPLAMWRGEALDLSVPLEKLENGAGQSYAVLVQEPQQGRIVGATKLEHTGG